MMLDLEDEMRSVNELLCRQIAVMLILCLVVPAHAPQARQWRRNHK